jgi:hypothetical protein
MTMMALKTLAGWAVVVGVLAGGAAIVMAARGAAPHAAQQPTVTGQQATNAAQQVSIAAQQATEEKVKRWVSQNEQDGTRFTLMGTEMVVADVEASLDFYRKCGFTLGGHGPPDRATGKITDATMHGGMTRLVFLQGRTTDADRAARKKMVLTFYIPGGPDPLPAHRDMVRANGLKPGDLTDKGSLRRYTVEDPDGYVLMFNTNIEPGGPRGAPRIPAE